MDRMLRNGKIILKEFSNLLNHLVTALKKSFFYFLLKNNFKFIKKKKLP